MDYSVPGIMDWVAAGGGGGGGGAKSTADRPSSTNEWIQEGKKRYVYVSVSNTLEAILLIIVVPAKHVRRR